MDTLSKMRKSAVTLPSVEGVNILRDPPKSIHTRKKERVNAGDITHHIRELKDRTSENIRYYPTAVNPMVSVSYANRGGGSNLTSIGGVGMAHNPYKVIRDGAFRPPMFRQEDLLPLSRQKRMWTTAQTRATPQYQHKTLQEVSIDFSPIKTAVLPNAVYNIGGTRTSQTYEGNAVLDPLTYSAVSALKGTSGYTAYDIDQRDASRYINKDSLIYNIISSLKGTAGTSEYDIDQRDASRYVQDRPITSYTTPGYSVQVFDATSRTMSTLNLPDKKLKDIVYTASKGGHIKFDGPNGQTIKLKDYTWTVYQTPKNTNVIVLETHDPDIELSRNLPLTSVNSRIRSRIAGNPEVLEPILENNRPMVSAHATTKIITGVTPVNDRDINIYTRKLNIGSYEPRPTITSLNRQDMIPILKRKK